MKILCLFATEAEAGVLKCEALNDGEETTFHRPDTLITGVGAVLTAWHLKNYLCSGHNPDLVINAGIAGSFRDTLPPGEVVLAVSDLFADLGMEEGEGFLPLYKTPFMEPDKYPFTGGQIICRNVYTDNLAELLRPVNAVTVNTVTGSARSAARLRNLYDPDIETMEGAAVFYVCAMERIPCIAIRAISNFAGPRDQGRWNTKSAIENLARELKKIFNRLQ